MLGAGASGAGMLETRGCSTSFTGETLTWKGAAFSFSAFTLNQ